MADPVCKEFLALIKDLEAEAQGAGEAVTAA